MTDKQNINIINLIVALEEVILNAESKKDAEHEGIIFLDKYSTIDNEGYLQYRLTYLLSRYDYVKKGE